MKGRFGMVTKYIPDLKFENIENAIFICVGTSDHDQVYDHGNPETRVCRIESIWISHERKMCCGLGKMRTL